MIETIIALLDHLNIESASFMGNSLGGGVAWQAAVTHPDRVNALILLAPSGATRITQSESNLGFKLLNTGIGRTLMKKVTPRFVIERSLKQTVVRDALVTDSMVDRYWQLLRMEGNRQAILDLRKSDRGKDLFNKMSDLSQPTLIVWGKSDRVLPVDMIRQFEQQLKIVESDVLTNIGHLPQEESVDTLVTRLNRFCRFHKC